MHFLFKIVFPNLHTMGQKKTTTFRTKKKQDYLITINQPPNFKKPLAGPQTVITLRHSNMSSAIAANYILLT